MSQETDIKWMMNDEWWWATIVCSTKCNLRLYLTHTCTRMSCAFLINWLIDIDWLVDVDFAVLARNVWTFCMTVDCWWQSIQNYRWHRSSHLEQCSGPREICRKSHRFPVENKTFHYEPAIPSFNRPTHDVKSCIIRALSKTFVGLAVDLYSCHIKM